MVVPGLGGTIERVEVSTRRDGKISRIEHFEADRVVAAEEDSDADGKIDKWETYDGDRLASVAFDTLHRGTADRRLIYGRRWHGAPRARSHRCRPLHSGQRSPASGRGTMTSVLYLGCPAGERDDAERLLRDGHVSVVWADNVAYALDELGRRDMPVLVDLSRGAAALQLAQEIRAHRASTLMFAVVDERRPDLTTEAVLAGVADVFARPLGGRRVAGAIERELNYESSSWEPQRRRPVQPFAGDAAGDRPDRRGRGEARGRFDPGRGRDRTPGRRARDSRAAERVRRGVCHGELRRLRHRGARRRAVRRDARGGELRRSGVARPGPRQP